MYSSSAQLKLTAKEGEPKARALAETDIQKPELLIVGTITGKIPGFNLTIDFDESKGKSTAWVYLYKSKVDDSTKAYAVFKTILGLFAMQIKLGDLLSNLPFNPETSFENVEWIDSDKMMEDIRDNVKYQDFLDVFPETFFRMGAILNDPMSGRTVWGVTFENKDSLRLNCVVDAVSEESICELGTGDIQETIYKGEISIYPNPARELAVLTIPNKYISSKAELRVYNSLGTLIYNLNNLNINSDGQIALSVDNLHSGVYTLVYSGLNHTLLTTRLVVVK